MHRFFRFLNRKRTERSHLLLSGAVFAFVTGSFVLHVLIGQTTISDGANAVDVLGQTDGNMPSPARVFTKGGIDDSPISSGKGMTSPYGGAFDHVHHRFFLPSYFGNRVLVYNLNIDDTFPDRAADFVLGQPDFTTTSAGLTQAKMDGPKDVAYDPTGDRLFVVDGDNVRVLVYDVASITNGENAINVLGQPNFTTATSVTAPPTAAGLGDPVGAEFDDAGDRLFVSDYTNNRVVVYNVAAITDGENAVNVLGRSNFTTNGALTQQGGMSGPRGLAYDPTGNRLFVADSATHQRVLTFDVAAITNGELAVGLLGDKLFTASDNNTTQNGFVNPSGLAFDDTNDRLFVADDGNSRVMVFDAATTTPDEPAVSVLGQANFTSGSTPISASQSRLRTAAGVAFDTTNNRLLVSDTDFARVVIYDSATTTVGEDGLDLLGQADWTSGTANGSMPGTGFFSARDVVVDETHHRIFVADDGNRRVLVYNLNNDNTIPDYVADNVLGQVDMLSSAGVAVQATIDAPVGLAYDSAGERLFVSDNTNNRVLVFDTTAISNGENAVNVLGQPDYVTTTAAASQSGLSGPRDLTYDAGTNLLYVADRDNSRVMIFDVAAISNGENAVSVLGHEDGTPPSITYNFDRGSVYDGPNSWGLNLPQMSVVDTVHHRLFVSEGGNHRVLVYNLNADDTFPDRVADNVLGQANFKTDTSGTTAATLNTPMGLAYDATGDRLFVADSANNRVMVFDTAAISNGENATRVLGQDVFTASGANTNQINFSRPVSLAYDASGNRLFVADTINDRVMVFDVTAITNGELAVGVLGQADFTSGVGATAQNRLNAPFGLVYQSAGSRLFVADASNNRVMIFDAATTTAGENAANVLGQSDFVTPDANTTQAGFSEPLEVGLDASGNRLFVADNFNNRVMVFDVAAITDGENAVNVLGQTDFVSAGTGATQSTFNGVNSASYDSSQNRLFVADNTNNRVMIFDVAAITNGENAADLLGQFDGAPTTFNPVYTKSAANGGAGSIGLSGPRAIAVDTVRHRLFVTDTDNNRVLVYTLSSTNTLVDRIADQVLGQTTLGGQASDTTASTLSGPYGLHYDSASDRLFVGDSGNSRVLVYDTASISNGEAAVNVLGQPNFTTGTNGNSGQADLWTVEGVAYDAGQDLLYAADTGNNRIMVFDAAAVAAGGGGGGGGGGGSPPPAVTVSSPNGGEEIAAGSHYTIYFTTQGSQVQNVRLSYSTDGEATYAVITSTASPTTGFYVWNVPNTSAATVLMRAQALGAGDGILATDTSNFSFRIVGGSATSTGQTGGSTGSSTTTPQTGSSTSTPETGSSTSTPETPPPSGAARLETSVRMGVNVSSLEFSTRQPAPVPGDVLTYRIDIVNTGGDTAHVVQLSDIIPPGTAYDAPSLSVNGVLMTDADDEDAATWDPVTRTAQFDLGDFAPGETVYVGINVVVLPGAATLTNQVRLQGADVAATSTEQTTDVDRTPPPVTLPVEEETPVEPAPAPIEEPVEPDTGAGAEPSQPAPSGTAGTPPEPSGTGSGAQPGTSAPSAPGTSGGGTSFISDVHLDLLEWVARSEETIQETPVLDAVAEATKNIPVVGAAAQAVRAGVKAVRGNETVQTANEVVVTPTVVTASAVATTTAVGFGSFARYAMFLLTQPISLLDRRKRKAYGTIYNVGTKMPVDLAVVRLYDAATKKLLMSRVTDRDGRYLFLPQPGTYVLEVQKPGFVFPPVRTMTGIADGPYADLHVGGPITTGEGLIAKNVPLEPTADTRGNQAVLAAASRFQIQWAIASVGPGFALASYAVTPRWEQLFAIVFQIAFLLLFSRLTGSRRPKSWGVITSPEGAPIKQAVVRVFESAYNKVLEARVTDARGRYAFLVGQNRYYLTAGAGGYADAKTDAIDFTKEKEPAFIAKDIRMQPGNIERKPAA